MNTRFGYSLLLSLIMVQASTWPPVHGFSWDMVSLMSIEFTGLLILACIQPYGGISCGIISIAVSWRFWPFISVISWWVAKLIHFFSGIISGAFSGSLSSSPDYFIFFGTSIASDPSKTAAFPITLFIMNYFFLCLVQTTLSNAFRQVFQAIPRILVFSVMRWLGFAFILAVLKPDLVSNGWQLFWGFWLLLSLSPIVFIPDTLQTNRTQENPIFFFQSWGLFAGLILIINMFPLTGFSPVPRVLIDEIHSKWEPVKIPFENRYDLTLAENNYGPWISFAEKFASISVAVPTARTSRQSGENFQASEFPHDSPGVSPGEGFPKPSPGAPSGEGSVWNGVTFQPLDEISEKVLSNANYDLLIEKCPTIPFQPREKTAILKFVEKGGTLLAIGEHTDVFFMNANLNGLLASAGVFLRSDGICDHLGRWLVTGGPFHSATPFSPSPGLYMWATGASIKPNYDLVPLAVSAPNTFSDKWVPQNLNFFGNLSPDCSHLYGPFIISGFVPYGRGKIIIHGDSTNFNASMISSPGKLSLTKNLLSSVNSYGQLVLVKVLLEFLFAIFSFLVLGDAHRNSFNVLRLFFPLFAAFIVIYPFLSGYSPEKTFLEKPINENFIVTDHSLKPTIGLSYGHQKATTAIDSLDKLLLQIQQEGFRVISTLDSLDGILDNYFKCLLLAEPAQQPTPGVVEKIRNWIARGGILFLVSKYEIAGPNRTIAMALGLRETMNYNHGNFPALLTRGSFSLINQEIPELTIHPVNSGAVIVLENWETLDFGGVDFPRLSAVIARFLRSRGKN